MQLPQLRRIRWAVRIALTLGVAASVAANVLHALPNPISQAIAAWPPLALLLTVELTSRIPMHRRSLAACRVFATIAIAGIAAWVSYWHMASVAAKYGETSTSAYLLPISVDGLIVVASVSLVELAGRIRMLEEQKMRAAQTAPAAPVPAPVIATAPVPTFAPPVPQPVPTFVQAPVAQAPVVQAPVSPAVGSAIPAPRSAAPVGEMSTGWVNGSRPLPQRANGSGSNGSNGTGPNGSRAVSATSTAVRTTVTSPARPAGSGAVAPTVPAAKTATTISTAPSAAPARSDSVKADSESDDTDGGAPRQRRPVQETAALADAIEAMHPNISQTELARQLGISATRLRAVRREAREIRRASRLRSA